MATTKQKVTGIVKCGLLNVRKEPSKSSDILTVIKKDTSVRILGEVDGFYKVYVKTLHGYCVKDFIEVQNNGQKYKRSNIC